MLTPTNYTVDTKLFKDACNALPEQGMKTTINKPTGNFFYEPWVLKDEYKGTVWETIYNSLPVDKGETRIIILDPGQCYQSHSDIDNRYHLSILGNNSFLIDLTNEVMHRLEQDGIWYYMDASPVHTAANFGNCARIQLVTRKLLNNAKLQSPIKVKIVPKYSSYNNRFLFDAVVSPWLNANNQNFKIANFNVDGQTVSIEIENSTITSLKEILPNEFRLELSI